MAGKAFAVDTLRTLLRDKSRGASSRRPSLCSARGSLIYDPIISHTVTIHNGSRFGFVSEGFARSYKEGEKATNKATAIQSESKSPFLYPQPHFLK